MSRYEKRGAAIRLSSGPRGTRVARILERGEAFDAAPFRARSLGPAGAGEPPPVEAAFAMERLARSAAGAGALERIEILIGSARHRWEDGGDVREWTEQYVRIHAALVRHQLPSRIHVDLGSADADEIDLDPLLEIAKALDEEGAAAPRARTLLLAPAAAAPLIAFLAASHPSFVRQTSHAAYARDGRGAPIEPRPGDAAPRNVFRPSYRIPARPALFHAALAAPVSAAAPDAEIVALVSSPALRGERIALRVLTRDGSVLRLETLPGRIHPAGDGELWFPHGAGVRTGSVLIEAI